MKILITSGIFPPDIGGPASYVPKIASELVRRNNEVTVLCLSDHNFDDSKFNFDVVRINRNIFLPLRVLITIFKIARLSLKSDLIFANTLTFESSLGALITKTKIVHKIVGDSAWERARNKGYFKGTIDEYQKIRKSFKLRFLDFYFKYFLKFSKRIITPSKYLKNIVLGWNSNLNIVTIYNAVDFPREFEKNSNESFSKIITVSRLVSWKNIDQIILSLINLKSFSLDIIGDGPEEKYLKDLVKENKLKDRVNFLGQLNQKEVFEKMKNSDVFILNSSYEGLPHVIVEAMYAKLPVICSNVGGCPEIVKNNNTGLLINESEGIESALLYMKERKTRESLIENALEFVRANFHLKMMCDLTIKALN